MPAAEEGFPFLTADSVTISVHERYDETGLLDGYYSHFSTPVCEDRQCLEAELVLYWDLLGNFQRFDTIPGRPLTKTDHEPFSDADYAHLERILLTKKPSFVYLQRDQLVRGGVDGITSATVAEVKQDMIRGAVYTCYTLWHIANGDIVFPIVEHTQQQLDERLVRKILSSEQTEQHYFILEHMGDEMFELFWPEILGLGQKYDGYFMMRIMEQMPTALLEKEEIQAALLRLWPQMGQTGKTILLEQLQAVNIGSVTGALLIRNLEPGNPVLNDQLVEAICGHAANPERAILQQLFETLIDRKIPLSAAKVRTLIGLGEHDPELKRVIVKFRRSHSQE